MASIFSTIGDAITSITNSISKAKGSSGAGVKEDATLLVNGKTFDGWTEIQIKRSLKAISGSFDLRLIDKWAEDKIGWQVTPGDDCEVQVEGETLISGFIDAVTPSFNSTQRSVGIAGRDSTCDLIDCSADHIPGNWPNISLERLANIMCKPFGISVTNNVPGLAPFQSWRIQPGESSFETLDRAAKFAGVLLVSDGAGGLVITRGSTERTATNLEQGVNILSANANYDIRERFSNYKVKSQNGGYDNEVIAVDLANFGTATDEVIDRYRPITIIAEGAATVAICKLRAQWEASFRAAKSARFTVVVYGWRQANGDLWDINKIVNFKSNFLGVNQDFLITGVTFSKGTSTTTTIELERPEAYIPDPTIKSRKEPLTQLVQADGARR